jgi:hypothetical protein
VSFLRSILFESWFNLLLVALPITLVLLVLWRRTVSARYRDALLGVVAAAALLLLVIQPAVETNREAIIRICHELAAATRVPDIEAIGAHVASDYADPRFKSKAELMQHVNATLTRYAIERPRVWRFDVAIDGDQATATFQGFCDVRRASGELVSNISSAWELTFVARDGRWRVRRIDARKIGPRDVSGLAEVLSW